MRKIILLLLLTVMTATVFAQAPALQGNWKELLAGLLKPADYPAWHNRMVKWRQKAKDSLKYKDDRYHYAGLHWAQSSYIQTQMMVEDRYFYDPVTQKYTVDRYLNDLKKRYGGLDAVLIWPTYPNIGIDNRNEFDMVNGMPGGINGVRKMVGDFKSRGVRVFFPIMIWDNGTRNPGTTIAQSLTKEMAAVGADGLNGDTMYGIPADFLWAKDGNVNYPLALEPEINMKTLDMLQWNTMSWAYYDDYIKIPGVSLYKWLEPAHQPILNDRWAQNKTDDLQYAWFNGMGYCAWENIWGIWNGVPKRYAEIIRRMHLIYNRYPAIFHSTGWDPHTPVLQPNVYASKFPGKNETLWTFVNRDAKPAIGGQVQMPYQNGVTYYDLWNGIKLTPIHKGNNITLSFAMEGFGYGAVLAVTKPDASLLALLAQIKSMAKVPLNSLPAKWQYLPQHIVNIPSTPLYKTAPVGMLAIPAAKNFKFDVKGVEIEGDDIPTAMDVQYPWEKTAGRAHHHLMDIKSFYIDQYPVTNAQFKKFMDATHYSPKDAHNFLKYWKNGTYPAGWANKPVTYVSIEDARAYAKWAGKRLPHEWEWQYAAQGMDGRLYPSGNKSDSTIIPPAEHSRNMRPPTDVTAYKEQSPFGVKDLIGNVWQWTDEYDDDHTRAAVIRGGSYYYAQTSNWYFPQAHKLNEHGKYLLMSPGRDREATLGFRCAADR
jgi:formylglycine-generating enzyme required for sulfatase activity